MINKVINRYSLFFAAFVLLVVPEIFYRTGLFDTTAQHVQESFDNFIDEKKHEAEKELKELLAAKTCSASEDSNPMYVLLKDEEPVSWSSSQIPIEEFLASDKRDSALNFMYLGNGYYLTLAKRSGPHRAIAFIKLADEYVFHNRYLVKKFSASLDIPDYYVIHAQNAAASKSQFPITYEGKTLFYVEDIDPDSHKAEVAGLIIFIQLAGVFLLFLSLVNFGVLMSHRWTMGFTTVSLCLLFLLKLWLSVMTPFQLMKKSEIFNPEIFASSTIDPSLGDFLLTFLTFFAGCYFLYKNYFLFLQGNKKRFVYYATIASVILLLGEYLLISGLNSLVVNSKIDFFFRNINSLNSNTIIGIFSLGFGLFGLLFLLSRLRNFYIQYPPVWKLMCLLHCGFLGFMYYYWEGAYIYHLTAFTGLLFVYVIWPSRFALTPFNSTAIVLLSFSVISATIFYEATREKEHNDRLLLAERLADNQDPDLEFNLSELFVRMRKDERLSRMLATRQARIDELDNYLDTTYFDKISRDYDLNYLFFTNDSTSLFQNIYKPGDLKNSQRITALYGKRTASRYLHFIYTKQNGLDYLAIIPLKEKSGFKIVIELRSKKLPGQAGLNELLANNDQVQEKLLADYSFIRFINNSPVEQRGNFQYKTTADAYEKYISRYTFFREEGYDHLIYRLGKDSCVVISSPFTGWLTHVTSFSYILILFALQFLIISYVLYVKKIKHNFFNLSGKIQLAFIFLTILAMTLFGLTTQYTIGKQYTVKNRNLVAEKLESILNELAQEFSSEQELIPAQNILIQKRLVKLSRIFNVDINVYSKKGLLVASSAPKIYRYHVNGKLMHPAAKRAFDNKSARFIHDENLGEMNYIAGYVQYENQYNKLIGYLNIDYFPRISSVNNEFSALLMAIINIFVVLFAFTILLSVIVTQIIISPLKKIRESLASMQLNKINKPISYKGHDELADLVREYNNKVADLEKYAYYLAQNERESAWREMAKQVAHEIKNPLTPMKLNIQHMQRSLKPDDPDFEQKLSRITQSLVEQIDTLTNIAGEFSSLAKMPGIKFEKVSYNQLLENIIELYNDEERTKIQLIKPSQEVFVNADKDQLLRVLNNLLKNAEQAIPESRTAEIVLKMEVRDNKVFTYVIDNGNGISPEQQDKIFQPNFTTKSMGSGLGLAMVKNIIEQHSGSISFETIQGTGTTFVFELPAI